MVNGSTLESPPFTRAVVNAMKSLYPLELADTAWDNVGLLLENADRGTTITPTVLLTNDLTTLVAKEAIRNNVSVIVSYHPFIFSGLKSVSLADPQQRILLQLAHHNIAVYCPHTSLDNTPGGMNDWMADMVNNIPNTATKKSVIKPTPAGIVPQGFEGAGAGRLVQFREPVPLAAVVDCFRKGFGVNHVMIARHKPHAGHTEGQSPSMVSSVAVCPGSGGDVLKGVRADVLVTGEMSHHGALHHTMSGRHVITVFHSNSERKFLGDVLRAQLESKLQGAHILLSEDDEDPYEIWSWSGGAGGSSNGAGSPARRSGDGE